MKKDPENKTTPEPLVPETLPSPLPETRPQRTVFFPFNLLGFWLLPRMTGPHLLAGGFAAALRAQFVVVLLAGCALALVFVEPRQAVRWTYWTGEQLPLPAEFTIFHRVRIALAALVAMGIKEGDYTLFYIPATYGVVLLMAIAVGFLAVPFVVSGETPATLARRSAKLGIWLTTLAAPLAVGFAVLNALYERNKPENWYGLLDNEHVVLGLILIGVTYGLWMTVRATAYYAGPAEGPGFKPITPRCTRCGYQIRSLPLSGNCPECSQSLNESLPHNVNTYETPPFVRKLARPTYVVRQIIFYPNHFFTKLPMRLAHPWAKKFFLRNAMAFLVASALFDVVCYRLDRPEQFFAFSLGILVLYTLLTMVAVPRLLLDNRRTDNRTPATVALFASAMIWPFTAVIVITFLTFDFLEGHTTFMQEGLARFYSLISFLLPFPIFVRPTDIAVGAAATVILILWGLTVRSGMRLTRFANH